MIPKKLYKIIRKLPPFDGDIPHPMKFSEDPLISKLSLNKNNYSVSYQT